MKTMCRRRIVISIMVLMVMLLLTACTGSRDESKEKEKLEETKMYVPLAPNVTADMCSADYWIENTDKPDEILMTAEEIEALNEKIFASSDTYTAKLSDVDTNINSKELQKVWADGISQPDHKQYYADGTLLTEKDYQSYRDNILNAKPDEKQELKYGICVERANMYGCPETEIITDDPKDPEYNEFQASIVRVNQPVLINGITADGCFYHVIGYDCEGWVLKEKIAQCLDREEWLEANTSQGEKLIITGSNIRLNASTAQPELSEKILTMGTALTLVPAASAPDMVENRSTWGNYVVQMPARDKAGNYYPEYALIPVTEDVNVGYLEMTKANILRVAFRQLGNRYGWGGMLNAVDCSAYIQEVYACFGLNLPRNSSWQAAIPAQKTSFTEDMTKEERAELFDSLPIGAIFQWSGHVMLNLGKVDDQYYVISAAGSLMNPEEEGENVSRIRSVLINDMSMKRPNGELWYDQVSTAVVLW